MGDVVAIANAILVRVAWRHPVAAVVEEQAGEEGVGALTARIALDGVIRKQLLNGFEGGSINDGFVFAFVDGALVGDFSGIEAVLE